MCKKTTNQPAKPPNTKKQSNPNDQKDKKPPIQSHPTLSAITSSKLPPSSSSIASTSKGFQKEQITNQPKATKTLLLKDEIDNLQSIYNNLAYLNQKIDNTFSSQRDYSENKLHEKLLQSIKLKEENFKLFSKLNSMTNINNIDEYFNTNYPRILQICPKVVNVLENIHDLISNINYGIDRFYLENNLICDENSLRNTIQSTAKEIDDLNARLSIKNEQIILMKDNYTKLLLLMTSEKEKCDLVKQKIERYRMDFLGNNINSIRQELIKENGILLNSLINDDD